MNKDKKGTVVGSMVGLVVFALSFYGVQQFFKPDMAAELKELSVELNKQTPMQIDEFVRLDSASSKGETNFIYHYTLVAAEKQEVNLDTVNKYIRTGIIENVKNHPDLKIFRDNQITMDYRYYDRKGDFVTEISVTPDLYKQ